MKHYFNVKSIMMVLIAVLTLAGTTPAMAQGKANQPVTLNLKQVTVKEFFSELKKQTGLNFVYSSDLASTLPKVTVNAKNKSAKQVLSEVMNKINCSYEIEGNIVTVTKKAADKKISGVVVFQDSEEPVIGASVRIEGTKIATVTDKDGKFSLDHSPHGAKVIVSYVGMDAHSMQATTNMYIRLKADINALNDVVVVGYGQLKKKDLTGSVAVVDAEELQNLPAVTIDDALAGKASGVQVTKSDGQPGGAVRIRVRGGSSLKGSVDPLYVIDGIPTEIKNNYNTNAADVNDINEWNNYGNQEMGGVSANFMRGINSLSGLNIADIESISILKDASATAIYGSKAANGVVIITTKRGKKDQKPTVNFNYTLNISNPIKEKVLNGEQYKAAVIQSLETSNKNIAANSAFLSRAASYMASNQEKIDLLNSLDNANTDWVDLVTRTGVNHTADVSVSGGGNSSRYYTSFSYTGQEGTLIGTDFSRLTGKINLDNDITNWFRMGTTINLNYSKSDVTNGLYSQALSAPPILSPYNEDGTFADYSKVGGVGYSYVGFQNPMALAQCTNQAKTYGMKGTIYAEIDLMKDLKFRSTASIDYNNYNQLNYVPSYVNVSSYYGAEDSNGGQGTQSQTSYTGTFFEQVLTYDKTFNDIHRLNAVAGTSWEQQQTSYFSASGTGYPDDDYLNNLGSAQIATKVDGANPSSKTSLLSFYLRANYSLFDRYLFTLCGRSDASSKFAKGNRVGYFPSGAVAWRINEESFMKSATWIDELKLRASMGKTGTQSISDHMFRTLYSAGAYNGSSALYPSQIGNENIKWETTTQKDLGLDFSFFRSRLGGSIAYYYKKTDGALLSITPALSSGFTSMTANIACVDNKGFEFELWGDIIRTKDWKWNASLNISTNRSKVLSLQGDSFSSDTERNELNLGTTIYKEGESLGLLCGYVAKGLLTTQEAVDDYKSRFSYWTSFYPDLGIGSVELALDESGMYYQDEIGCSQPDFYGGFNTQLQYKNWSLMAQFTFSYGNDLIYMKDVSDVSITSMGNRGIRVLEASSADNFTGKQLSTYKSNNFLTSLNVYDASYLKLQSLTLNYALPKSIIKKCFLTSASAFLTATNLFTITKYPGPDPAVSDDPYSVAGGGRDVTSYPTVRSFSFGVRVGF